MGLSSKKDEDVERRESILKRAGFTGSCLDRLVASKTDPRKAVQMLGRYDQMTVTMLLT